MRYFSLVLLTSVLVGCSSTNDKQSREVAANKEREAVTKRDYYDHRGKAMSKTWEYDGYNAQVFLFGKAILKKDNIEFLKTGSSLRQYLFENNLGDTGVDQALDIDCEKEMYMKRRTPDGSCYFYGMENKLNSQDAKLAGQILMGAKGQRFGRNTRQESANTASAKDIMEPNPFEVSERLLVRKKGKKGEDGTKKATILNLLAAAWLQSMNHDWFTHGKNSKTRHHSVKGYSKHPSFNQKEHKIPYTRSESGDEKSTDKNGYHYTSRNQVTHWWDASQIYGSDQKTIDKVRTKYNPDGTSTGNRMPLGKIAVDEKNKRLIYGQDQLPITGFHDNWWIGLEMIQTLFHLEHNRIIDKILMPQVGSTICKDSSKKNVSASCENELFELARLINSALIAKIHTVEWTPALLDHPMLHIAMRANWYGLRELWGGDSASLRAKIPQNIKHVVSGLTGEKTLDLYGAPFTLTEEFVAVYRMHPLIPDNIDFRSVAKADKVQKQIPIEDVVFRKSVGKIKEAEASGNSTDWMYTFGTSHPGGLLLHNHPTFMHDFVAERNTGEKHTDSVRMDMGAIDIFRDRERGVPRYNNFRRALGLPPITSFEELTNDANDVATLKDVYDGDVEKLDLLVGSLAEKDRYPGYAFGNTPFWIFAIMASRRLMADPFFSDLYIPEVYTQAGIDFVQKTSMVDVVLHHYPELKSQFYTKKKFNHPKKGWITREVLKVKNAFRPWGPVYDQVKSSL